MLEDKEIAPEEFTKNIGLDVKDCLDDILEDELICSIDFPVSYRDKTFTVSVQLA